MSAKMAASVETEIVLPGGGGQLTLGFCLLLVPLTRLFGANQRPSNSPTPTFLV